MDCAAAAGAFKSAQLLLENNAPIDPLDRTKTTPLHLAAENGHAKLVDLLLSYGADLTKEDSQSMNPLERAIMSGQKNCVTSILEHKDWKVAMRTSHFTKDDHGTIVPETPMRLLIRTYPDLAELVFNKCIVRKPLKDNGPDASPKSVLEMNFEFIDDAFYLQAPKEEGDFFKYCNVDNNDECAKFDKAYNGNAKVIMDNHPLMIMAKEEQRNLLRHPLCLALVRRKWISHGRYVYYLSLSTYLLFLIFLTSFALLIPNANSDFKIL